MEYQGAAVKVITPDDMPQAIRAIVISMSERLGKSITVVDDGWRVVPKRNWRELTDRMYYLYVRSMCNFQSGGPSTPYNPVEARLTSLSAGGGNEYIIRTYPDDSGMDVYHDDSNSYIHQSYSCSDLFMSVSSTAFHIQAQYIVRALWMVFRLGSSRREGVIALPEESLPKEVYLAFQNAAVATRIESHRHELNEVRAQLANLEQRYVATLRSYEDLSCVQFNVPPNRLDQELDKARKLPYVESITLGINSYDYSYSIKIATKPLVSKLPGGDLPLGKFDIIVSVSPGVSQAGVVRILPAGTLGEARIVPHMHAQPGGSICWGGFGMSAQRAAVQANIDMVCEITYQWLQTYQPSSRYYSLDQTMVNRGMRVLDELGFLEEPKSSTHVEVDEEEDDDEPEIQMGEVVPNAPVIEVEGGAAPAGEIHAVNATEAPITDMLRYDTVGEVRVLETDVMRARRIRRAALDMAAAVRTGGQTVNTIIDTTTGRPDRGR